MEQMSNTVWMRGYTPEGFQVSLTLGLDATPETVAQLLAKVTMAKQAGLLASAPGLTAGQDKEAIATCIRRASASGVPIVDFYPAWGFEGQFGEHKYAHLYLNTPAEIAQFEAQSGLRLADMPLRDEATALKRTYGKVHPHEVNVKRSFEMLRTPDGQYDNGMPKWKYGYLHELPLNPVPASAPKPDNPPAPKQDSTPQSPESPASPLSRPTGTPAPMGMSVPSGGERVDPNQFFTDAQKRGVQPKDVLKRLGVQTITSVSKAEAYRALDELGGNSTNAPLVG